MQRTHKNKNYIRTTKIMRFPNAKQKLQRKGEEHKLLYHLILQIKWKIEIFFFSILIKKVELRKNQKGEEENKPKTTESDQSTTLRFELHIRLQRHAWNRMD